MPPVLSGCTENVVSLARNGDSAPFGEMNSAMKILRPSESKAVVVPCFTRVLGAQKRVFSPRKFFSAASARGSCAPELDFRAFQALFGEPEVLAMKGVPLWQELAEATWHLLAAVRGPKSASLGQISPTLGCSMGSWWQPQNSIVFGFWRFFAATRGVSGGFGSSAYRPPRGQGRLLWGP